MEAVPAGASVKPGNRKPAEMFAAGFALMRIAPTYEAREKLQQVIKGCLRYTFVFLANREIPPTNNGSERTLRPCVIFRKETSAQPSKRGGHRPSGPPMLTIRRRQSWCSPSRRQRSRGKCTAPRTRTSGRTVPFTDALGLWPLKTLPTSRGLRGQRPRMGRSVLYAVLVVVLRGREFQSKQRSVKPAAK